MKEMGLQQDLTAKLQELQVNLDAETLALVTRAMNEVVSKPRVTGKKPTVTQVVDQILSIDDSLKVRLELLVSSAISIYPSVVEESRKHDEVLKEHYEFPVDPLRIIRRLVNWTERDRNNSLTDLLATLTPPVVQEPETSLLNELVEETKVIEPTEEIKENVTEETTSKSRKKLVS